jgi:DNA-binding FadR family transcriptional regulator
LKEEHPVDIQRLKRRTPLSADIAKQLHDTILSGKFKPGDLLPGQRDLAESFGASIASVREAISVLTAIGLLDVRPGRGTTVVGMTDLDSPFDGWLGLADSQTAINDLLEVRRLLETFIAKKAAERVTEEQKTRLNTLLEAMQDAINAPDAYLRADMALHQFIADLAGNMVLTRMMKIIRVPLMWQLRNSNLRHLEKYGNLKISFETHERLVHALIEGNGRKAVASINEMVDRAATLLTDNQQRDG